MHPTLVRVGILLAVVIGLTIWAADFAGTRPAHERRTGSSAPTPPATAAPPAAVAAVEAPSAPVAAAQSPAAAQPEAEQPVTDEGLADDERSRTHRGLTVRQAREREAMIATARKREADNLAQHQKNTQLWNSETRDEARAKPIEGDITQLLIDADIDHMLVDVTCRETMCMLEVDLSGSHSAISALHATPGVTEALGGDAMSAGFKDDDEHQQRTFVLLGPAKANL